ncbi:tyrosine-type recombinase/integrase, partial [bacterium]|nr:tyrosine-type recombinase/integrase [bacterium]
CGLMWDCVNFQSQTVEIKRVCNWDLWTKQPKIRENTKTGVFRKIVMPEKLVQLLTEWKALNPEQQLVFHRKGELIKYNAIQRAYKDAFKKLGLPMRSTHVLRHSFASIYANQTRNIRGAQAALGHQDLRITQHYAKVTEQTQRDAIVDFEFGKIKKSNPSPDNGGMNNVISLNSKRANCVG